jgi:hypothetical protein
VFSDSNDSSGCAIWFKWLVGVLIALLAAGGSIVALLNYFSPQVVTPEKPVLSCPQPPPVEQINVTPKEGYVWIQADWNWDGGKFEFTPGHWERERADYGPYIPGHWDTSNGNCVWIPGTFEGEIQNSTITTTDH